MSKPRVIISSDIGGSDPDDFESMVHAFLAADQIAIEGLISTPTKNAGRASDIHTVIDLYAQDYANLKTWSSDYPTPDYLKSVVRQGSINVNAAGYGAPTEASKLIIEKAHASNEPLWVFTWGAMTDLAQALHDDPSIAPKLKVYSSNGWNGTQDPYSRDYIYNNFEDLWWVESKSTHRGLYVNESGVEGNSFKMSDAKDHGALGDFFYQVRPWGIKMGDTPSILRLLDGDSDNDGDPSADGWGGAFVKTGHGPSFWTDNPDPALKLGTYNGARTVYEHQAEIYKDMARLFDRAQKPNPDGPTADPAPDPTPSTGSGNPVVAYDDTYKADPGKALYFNSRYLTHNDKGLDGGLKVTAIDTVSAQGVSVSWATDGTVVYRAPAGWNGTDAFNYIVQDADGSTDTAKVKITVGTGISSGSPGGTGEPADSGDTGGTDDSWDASGSAGTGNMAITVDDMFKIDPGKTLYFDTGWLDSNDKGLDGGLKVAGFAGVSGYGVTVSQRSDGTIVYRAPKGWNGSDTLSYTMQDVDGSTDTATVFITSGSGTDPLPTGAGTDKLAGGDGADKFVILEGDAHGDIILDFSHAVGERVATDYTLAEITSWSTATLTLQSGGGSAEELQAVGHLWGHADFLF